MDQESKSGDAVAPFEFQGANQVKGEGGVKPPKAACFTWRRCELWTGVAATVVGVTILLLGCIGKKPLNNYRAHKLRENLVIDSKENPNYDSWATNSAVKTPVYTSYYFYNLTNPKEFMEGANPVLNEVGPYDFEIKSQKYNVTFSDGGNLVSYVNLQRAEFQGDPAALDDQINFLNVPYFGAAGTVGGEQNLLRMGSQEGLVTMKEQFSNTFVPTLRENAVAKAIAKSLDAIDPLNDLKKGSVASRWGGGCATYLFIKRCGFDDLSDLLHFLGPLDMSLELARTAINPRLDAPGLTIPPSTVRKLWKADDPLSLLNVDRDEKNSSIRYGISYWLWGNETVQEEITSHFNVTDKQFVHLRSWLHDLYNSPDLWENVVHTYLKSLPSQGERDTAKAEIKGWDDLVWRQWLRSDVISGLQDKDKLESVQIDNPPEFYWYQRTLKGPSAKRKWSKKQAMCLFDVAARRSNQYFQSEVLKIPSPGMTNRPQFMDEQLPHTDGEAGDGDVNVKPKIQTCLKDDVDAGLLDGYLTYVATNLVAPEFQKRVLDQNGGLVTVRTVSELVLGHKAPILEQLPSDDPRAKSFALAVNDKSLTGPALCESVADVDNLYSACTLVGATPVTDEKPQGEGEEKGVEGRERLFAKVPHTYHTGKDDPKKIGALQAFHGDKVAWGIWPSGNLTIEGAVAEEAGSVQYGYSDGMTFPAFDQIDEAKNLWMFIPQFVMPLKLAYVGEVNSRGINLQRFTMAPDTFSPARPDASVFGMDPSITPDGLLNITGLYHAPVFLSKPHAVDGITGLRAFDKDRDESYLDIEKETGRTMNAKIQLQMSVSTADTELFTQFYPKVYRAQAIPVFYLVQHANVGEEDAHFFVSQVYASKKLIKKAVTGASVVGALLAMIGMLMVGHALYIMRRKPDGGEPMRRDIEQGSVMVGI